MYRTDEAPNFASFAAAARTGHPDSVIAFNPGVVPRILSVTPHEDYTAGEINDPNRVETRRAVDGRIDGTQVHIPSQLAYSLAGVRLDSHLGCGRVGQER